MYGKKEKERKKEGRKKGRKEKKGKRNYTKWYTGWKVRVKELVNCHLISSKLRRKDSVSVLIAPVRDRNSFPDMATC